MSPPSPTIHISTSHPTLTPGDTPKFTLTVSNPRPHPITVLTWSTPFDPKAAVLGIFKAVWAEDPEERVVEGRKIMFRRVTPPPRSDLVEISAEEKVVVEVELPDFPFEAGKEYRVWVEGRWMSIWGVGKESITDYMLEEFGGEGMVGEFKSDEVAVKVQ